MLNKSIYLLLIVLASCSCSKNISAAKNETAFECPDGGKCELVIEKGKRLEIRTFSNGALGYELTDDKTRNVVRFNYGKNLDQVEVDGGYREEVVFEVAAQTTSLTLTGKSLQETKMLFGRYCFCRGQTGLYRVNDGQLQLYSGTEISFDLHFQISEVPQVIKSISVKEGRLQ